MTAPRPKNYPASARSAAEIAEKLDISAERIIELAESGFMPHVEMSDGTRKFILSHVRDWLWENDCRFHQGRPVVNITITAEAPPAKDEPPKVLKNVPDLRQFEATLYEPGIYFLCHEGEVVYVGQSANPIARIGAHTKTKTFNKVFFLPCPVSELDYVESRFIHAIQPRENGNIYDKNGPKRKAAPLSPAMSGVHSAEDIMKILNQ